MPTQLQKNLAEEIVKNYKLPPRERKNKGELLESAGYSIVTAEASPGRTLEQKGVKEVLAQFGLTEGLIIKALVEDIASKPQRRIQELNLGAEILNMKKRIENGNKTLILAVSGESANRFNIQKTDKQ